MGVIVLCLAKGGGGRIEEDGGVSDKYAFPKTHGETGCLEYTAVTFSGGNHLKENRFLRNNELHHVP